MVNHSRLVERGEAVVCQQRETYEKEKGKDNKWHSGGFGGRSSSKRPPKHPRQQSYSRGSSISQRPSRNASSVEDCIGHHDAKSAMGGATGVAD